MELMQIKTYHHAEILPHLPLITQWHAEYYKHHPWDYTPPANQVVAPFLTKYTNEKESILVTAEKGGHTLAFLLGMPLNRYAPELQIKFRVKGLEPDEIMLAGYFLLSSTVQREEKMIHEMYSKFETYAKKLHKNKLVYLDMLGRTKEGPIPQPWGHQICNFKPTEVMLDLPWSHQNKPTTIPMVFHIRNL